MTKHIPMKHDVLQTNKTYAEQNRTRFYDENTFTINLISSPGSGKTSVLEKTIKNLKTIMNIGVIEGDVATDLDAARIAKHNVKAVQINTHGACHLDAKMVAGVLSLFPLKEIDLMVIENVGNLVCPAAFDLGEHVNVALLSTTEGADKVVKYPTVFENADVVLLNKIDLLPYTGFDLKQFRDDVHQLNPDAPIFELSAHSGEGIGRWTKWLKESWVSQTQAKDFDWT
ncbi:hydrogenase nickel incorporation protein HypB [Thalassobacillus devorans]|uniref:hydrogenase nickel incorporation protein HypB n=1 Tax=Thalassobacillus devorans TaxID=279813 RepID=UPI0004B8C5BB|nr:hydrogenase nickel incorporation protein HypB [Thalassobacillus devorans]